MSKTYQTSEKASIDALKSRWYKANFQMTKKAVLEVLDEFGFKPQVTDDTYGEIYVESNQFVMTITIYEYNPTETSVDIYYQSKRFFDFGASKKDISIFYSKLSEKLVFKGLSLHP